MVTFSKKPKALKYLPKGFHTFVTNCGIKDKSLDLGVVVSEKVCTSAAFFTKNKIKGEPIKVAQKHYQKNNFRALVVNSKNSNVSTGKQGYENCINVCQKVASQMKIPLHSIFPSSTGAIGINLPVDKICSALNSLSTQLTTPPNFENFSKAIMTTDTFPKYISSQIGKVKIVGVTKGSGMIEPNMATTLSYFFTDAKISSDCLRTITQPIIDKTFNSLSIDSDMSTSDTLFIMANGLAHEVDENKFSKTFEEMSIQMTRWLARDGEGASKLFIVDVKGAVNENDARSVGKNIINSPLVKTAISKSNPNWGRIYMAIGKTSQAHIIPDKIQLSWGEKKQKNDSNINQTLSHYLKKNEEIFLEVNLNIGNASWRVYGCDLTEEYVKINANYLT